MGDITLAVQSWGTLRHTAASCGATTQHATRRRRAVPRIRCERSL